MVKFVEDELMAIRNEVLDMWALVYDQMKNISEALPTADKDKAGEVIIRENASTHQTQTRLRHRGLLVLYNRSH